MFASDSFFFGDILGSHGGEYESGRRFPMCLLPPSSERSDCGGSKQL
jgi:hypothetical protein